MGNWAKFWSAIVGVPFAIGIVYVFVTKGFASAEAAGWAQAVGTVGAIAVTAYIASQNSRQLLAAAREERLRNMSNALQVASVGVGLINGLSQQLRQNLDEEDALVPAEYISSGALRDYVALLTPFTEKPFPLGKDVTTQILEIRLYLLDAVDIVEDRRATRVKWIGNRLDTNFNRAEVHVRRMSDDLSELLSHR